MNKKNSTTVKVRALNNYNYFGHFINNKSQKYDQKKNLREYNIYVHLYDFNTN